MYYSNEHIKDLSTYKTALPAFGMTDCSAVSIIAPILLWKSNEALKIICSSIESEALVPQVSLRRPSVWTNPSAYLYLSSYQPSPEHRSWINELPPIYPDHHYLLEHLKDSKRLDFPLKKKKVFMHLKRKPFFESLLWKGKVVVYFYLDPSEEKVKDIFRGINFPRKTFTSNSLHFVPFQ